MQTQTKKYRDFGVKTMNYYAQNRLNFPTATTTKFVHSGAAQSSGFLHALQGSPLECAQPFIETCKTLHTRIPPVCA